jgi:hypothetical protein
MINNTMKLDRGKKLTIHSAITASVTSANCKNYDSNGQNAMILYLYINGTGTWTVKIQGKSPSGVYMDMYDVNGSIMAISSATASKAQLFVGIPSDFKIVPTEDADGAAATIGIEMFSV